VTPWVEWSSAERAERATGFNEARDRDSQSAGPFARQRERQLILTFERLERDLHGVRLFIDRHGDITGDEVCFVLRFKREVVGQVAGTSQLSDHLSEPLAECLELLFLTLDDDEAAALSCLEEKETVPDFTTHTDHHLVRVFEDVVHEGAKSLSDPVLLTVRTTGVVFVKPIALIEQVEITVR